MRMALEAERLIGTTESLCPRCLARIPAAKVAVAGDVYLKKCCPRHGEFRTIIWRGLPGYEAWADAKLPSPPPLAHTAADHGCPFDCGLCPGHRQHSCCVLLEVTGRCNLRCPLCFAAAGEGDEPSAGEIEAWYRLLLASGGPYNIQLSGGEPTLRDDLPEIVARGRALGFSFIQLNTNGLRLATDGPYLRRLKEAGLGCVFLQFDGTDDRIYRQIRGQPLLAAKTAAIDRCAEAGLGVVLVPTLVPAVNTADIGNIIDFALARLPAVRGVHFQPVSYFGRYPAEPADADRITIPEVLRAIEEQTAGKMKTADFHPPGAENAHCSFSGNFLLTAGGEVKTLARTGPVDGCCQPRTAADGARKARAFVARRWSAPAAAQPVTPPAADGINIDSLTAFLARAEEYSLCVSGMAFQDAWNLDLERLRDCFIHVAAPGGRIIPFCAYNLTAADGKPLYRPQGD